MAADAGIVQLKVTLTGIEPPVWRRLVVAGGATLEQLHEVLQVAMGWEDCHLHAFEIGGVAYGPLDEDSDPGEIDEQTVTVAAAFRSAWSGTYAYDFGDSWRHELLLEEPDDDSTLTGIARCTAGARACPPEDCGGPAGYRELLEALARPDHARHAEYRAWLGGGFDPEAFAPTTVNAGLDSLLE